MAINDYDDLILGAAKQYNIDPQLLKATMQVESGGNPNIHPSTAGAQGLMQFIPSTAKQYNVNVNDPRSSIYGGAHYISDLLGQYKDPDIAMQHYSGNTPGYGGMIVKAYRQLQRPVASQGSNTAMADAPATQLPPDELQSLFGSKPPASTGKSAGAPAAAPPPAAAPTTPPPAAAPASTAAANQQPWYARPVTDYLPSWLVPSPDLQARAKALEGGVKQGINTVGTNLGINMRPPSPTEQAATTLYPNTAAVGNFGGSVAATAPAVAAADVLPAAVGARVAPGLIRAGIDTVRGGIGGGVQNYLAGDPNEPGASRAESGFFTGLPFGLAGNRLSSWFGGNRTLEPEVVNAARTAQREGVSNITADNLPGGSIRSRGAAPDPATARQIDNAASRILGDNVPDFSNTNLAAIRGRIGNAVTRAANSGNITADQGFEQALDTVSQYAQSTNVGNRIDPLINQIRGRIQNGTISGADFDRLVGNGSPLHDLVGDDDPYVSRAAQALDRVMDRGFQLSSPPGSYDDWVDARTRYRMLRAVQQSVLSNGHIDPAVLFTRLRTRFPDIQTLNAQTGGTVGRMGDFASAVQTLFGGPEAQAAARNRIWGQMGGEFLKTAGVGGIGEIANLVGGGGWPGWTMGTAITGGTAAAAAAARGVGEAYQRSAPFVNSLISRGGRAAGNLLSPYLGAAGTETAPDWRKEIPTR